MLGSSVRNFVERVVGVVETWDEKGRPAVSKEKGRIFCALMERERDG